VSVYSAPWYTPAVQRLLDLALEEDVGRGDVTTASVIEEAQEAEADITSRDRVVVCGLGVVEAVFTRFDWRTRVRMKVADGDPSRRGRWWQRARPAAALLAGEAHGAELLAAPVRDRDLDPGVRGRGRRGPRYGSPTRARPRPRARAGEIRRSCRRRGQS